MPDISTVNLRRFATLAQEFETAKRRYPCVPLEIVWEGPAEACYCGHFDDEDLRDFRRLAEKAGQLVRMLPDEPLGHLLDTVRTEQDPEIRWFEVVSDLTSGPLCHERLLHSGTPVPDEVRLRIEDAFGQSLTAIEALVGRPISELVRTHGSAATSLPQSAGHSDVQADGPLLVLDVDSKTGAFLGERFDVSTAALDLIKVLHDSRGQLLTRTQITERTGIEDTQISTVKSRLKKALMAIINGGLALPSPKEEPRDWVNKLIHVRKTRGVELGVPVEQVRIHESRSSAADSVS